MRPLHAGRVEFARIVPEDEIVGELTREIDVPLSDAGNRIGRGARIRRATIMDVDELMTLSRRAFGRTVKWGFAPKLVARWYWRAALESESCEAWVLKRDARVLGYYMLVVDPRQWARERAARPGSWALRLFLLVCRPHVWPAALASRVRRLSNGDGRRFPPPSERQRGAWLDWIAVDEELRGQGVGKELLEHCEDRCRAHGCRILRLDVFKNNSRAQDFYLREGFESTGEWGNVRKFAKQLAPAERNPVRPNASAPEEHG